MRNKIIVFFVLFVFRVLSASSIYAEEISLTLNEAISIVLRDNKDILLKSRDIEKAKLKIAEAQAELFPTLNFTGSRTYTRGYYPKNISATTTQTTLKQYLYKGGKIIHKIKYNEHKLDVAIALLEKTELETILNIEKAFYTLLLANEFVTINRAILQNSQAHLDFMQALYQNGQASETEILQIKEALGDVEQAYDESLNQVESSQALMRSLLYLDDDIMVNPEANFDYEPKEIAYDEAFIIAMKNRPEIRQHEAQEKADKYSIEVAKADNRPNIYASWDYYSRSTTSLTFSPTKGWQDYNVIGLTFSWPIFDGWATKAKVEQAIVDLKQTQITKAKTIKEIATELKEAYLELKNAISKIKSTQLELDLYKDMLKIAEEKYKSGILSSLDLSDASLGYEVSLFNQKQTIYDYVLAKARFENAMGE